MLRRKVFAAARTYATSTKWGGLSAAARPAAEAINVNWQGLRTDGGTTKNYIGGEFLGKLVSFGGLLVHFTKIRA